MKRLAAQRKRSLPISSSEKYPTHLPFESTTSSIKWNSLGRHGHKVLVQRHHATPKNAILFIASSALLYNVIFAVRYATMSRPSWLYPSMRKGEEEVVAKCFLESPDESMPKMGTDYEWTRFQRKPETEGYSHKLPKLLIAQYVGGKSYLPLLEATSSVNLAYAERWGADVVVLKGTAMPFSRISTSCNAEMRSTFNKIPLLEHAIEQHSVYDYVLILDTDAMIVDFDVFLPDLLSRPTSTEHEMLAAQKVWRYDWSSTWDVNAGVTLWNLHHPAVGRVVDAWKQLVQQNQKYVLTHNDDQFFLQRVLQQAFFTFLTRPVRGLTEEFKYNEGTVVKHFIRTSRSWTTTGLEVRLQDIQAAVTDVCAKFQPCQYRRKTP